MHVWALANQKGGTGKTTTAIHLAAALAGLGKRVLLVDLDPQAHASMGLSVASPQELALARVFLGERRLSEITVAVEGGFHLAPSSLELSEFEQAAERMIGPERVLARALAEVHGRYDWVLIDCPPRAEGVLCANAVRASETALLVVEMGAFALQGALRARVLFEELAADVGHPLDLRVVGTLFDRRTRLARELLIGMQARFGPAMFDTVIRTSVRLREAAAFGVPAQQLDPSSAAVSDFDALARECLAQAPPTPRAPRSAPSREALAEVPLPASPAHLPKEPLPEEAPTS